MIGFGRSQFSPDEASWKFYYWHAHCASHYFVNYAMTVSFISSISCRFLNYIIQIRFIQLQQNTTNHVCNAIFVFAIIVQSHVPITLFLVNGSVKLIPVAIQLFQQRGLEISIRFLQTIVLHRIVIHVVITHVNDNFFQVFYQLIHRTPGFLPKCGTMLQIQIIIKL